MESVKWILPNSPLENKARKRALFVSINTTLKPVWMKIPSAHRRARGKPANKKAPFIRCLKKWWTGQDSNL